MKEILKRILVKTLELMDRHSPLSERVVRMEQMLNHIGNDTQVLLSLKYKELMLQKLPLPKFQDVEFRAFSQNGEDGILLYLFSLIGTTNKKAIEICAGDGIECNTANLIINHGWTGLLFDGNDGNVTRGKAFYSTCPTTWVWPPAFVHAWITTDNINSLIRENGFEGEIDLLSLDMDGVDYWVWKAIHCIQPRVVVLEFNNLWGPDQAVTVPYRPDFRTQYNQYGCDYSGASLAAFVNLGREKGYRLVGCQRYSFNAFFLRSDVGAGVFAEVQPAAYFQHPFAQHAMTQRLPNVVNREWIKV